MEHITQYLKVKVQILKTLENTLFGDNIKDIDWKASARSPVTLVKQYRAERKHNIMLVLDTGKKMLADTESLESKNDVASMTAGTVAYLASKNGDYIGAIYNKENSIQYFPLKLGLFNIEKILTNYEKDIKNTMNSDIEKSLEYISNNVNRKMVIFVITDLSGMESIKDTTLKKLSIMHDVLFVNINDAYMTGNNAYDVDTQNYIPQILLKDKKLHELERKVKQDKYEKIQEKLKTFRIQAETINSNKEIITKTINLLERHKHANIS